LFFFLPRTTLHAMDPHLPQNSIYVIDDEESVGRSLVRLLVLEGFKAEAFTSARSFLDSVPFDSAGCVISDIYMPDIDGFALQQTMRQLGYRMPVIFISGHAKGGDREYAMEHGAAGFLVKPFDERSLLDLIRAAEESKSDLNRTI
jgi:two-component system, LuxR family, response regulator FixJ